MNHNQVQASADSSEWEGTAASHSSNDSDVPAFLLLELSDMQTKDSEENPPKTWITKKVLHDQTPWVCR